MKILRRIIGCSLSLLVLFTHTHTAWAYESLGQSDWSGGYGQQVWGDSAKFNEYYHVDYKTPGELKIPGNDTWYDSAWKHRRRIEIDNSEQGELDHFPLLVVLEHKVNIDYLKAQSDDGYDLRFTDSDGTTLIPHDVERWDQGGKSYIWVKIPQIKDHQKDYFYVYYGNPTAEANLDPHHVWDNGFQGVWHLSQRPKPGGNYVDVTQNQASGTLNDDNGSSSSEAQTQIGLGQLFENSDYINFGDKDHFTPNQTTGFTTSIWVKNTQNFRGDHFPYYIAKDSGTGSTSEYGCWGAAADNNYRCRISIGGSFVTLDSNISPALNQWEHISFTWNGTTATMYLNGTQVVQATANGSVTNIITDLMIGARTNAISTSSIKQGSVDEFRISNKTRSGDWIAAEYKSETNTYLTYGNEELFGSELLSSIFDAEKGMSWGYLVYEAEEPEKTAAKVKVRTGNNMYLADAADFATCESITNKTDISTNKCVRDGDRYIQYQVILDTTEANKTPTFKSISITDFLPSNIKPVVKGISTVSSPSPPPLRSIIYDLESPQAGPRPSPSLDPASPAGRPNPYWLNPIFNFLNALIH